MARRRCLCRPNDDIRTRRPWAFPWPAERGNVRAWEELEDLGSAQNAGRSHGSGPKAERRVDLLIRACVAYRSCADALRTVR